MNNNKLHKKKHKHINCRKCIHFYITWDTSRPYGCRVMGFKGKLMPSMMVFKSTGENCLLFQKKTGPKRHTKK